MKKIDVYNREEVLKERFNNFWCRIAQSDTDFYNNLTDKDLLELKIAIKNINDILTYKTTIKFLEILRIIFNIDTLSFKETKEQILRTKPNSNGYDIRNDKYKIIAEIKCNLPLNNGNHFGREQRHQLQKDIEYLLNGKKKVTNLINDNYFKFLGIYNNGKPTEVATHKFLESKYMREIQEQVEILEDPINDPKLTKDKVYIVYI